MEIRATKPFANPTLFVKGSRSQYVLDSDTPLITELFPAARIVSIDGSHWVHAEAPDPFAETVMRFLSASA